MAPAAAVLLLFEFSGLACHHSLKAMFLRVVSLLKKGDVHLLGSARL